MINHPPPERPHFVQERPARLIRCHHDRILACRDPKRAELTPPRSLPVVRVLEPRLQSPSHALECRDVLVQRGEATELLEVAPPEVEGDEGRDGGGGRDAEELHEVAVDDELDGRIEVEKLAGVDPREPFAADERLDGWSTARIDSARVASREKERNDALWYELWEHDGTHEERVIEAEELVVRRRSGPRCEALLGVPPQLVSLQHLLRRSSRLLRQRLPPNLVDPLRLRILVEIEQPQRVEGDIEPSRSARKRG